MSELETLLAEQLRHAQQAREAMENEVRYLQGALERAFDQIDQLNIQIARREP
jgi:hypothetical protein